MHKIFIGDFRFEEESKKEINYLLEHNLISEGKKCKEFQKKFAKYIGTKYSIVANSGTSTLMLILSAMKYHSKYQLKEKTKIITTPLTYIATSNSIVTTGFEPVYADIEKNGFNISPEKIKIILEENEPTEFSAIMPVHLMGYAAEMNKINKIAKKYGLAVIEDAAEAHGTIYDDKIVGSIGDAGSFSFYIAHNIQVGEFGAITTNDEELADKINRLKGNGRICACTTAEINQGKCPHQGYSFHPRYLHDMIGYNFKAMEYQGAVGLVQLKSAKKIMKKRQENVKYLNEKLEKIEDKIILPKYSKKVSYLGYPLLIKDKKISRNKVMKELEKKGIEQRPIFNSIPTQQPAYAYLKKEYEGKVNNAEKIGNTGFYVGIHQYLTKKDLDYMAKTIIKTINN